MKIFIPFEESLLDELLTVGEALVPFQLAFQRNRVSWEQVEVLEDADPSPGPQIPAGASPLP